MDWRKAPRDKTFRTINIVSGIFCPSIRNSTNIEKVCPQAIKGHPEYKGREVIGMNGLREILGLSMLTDAEFVAEGQAFGKLIGYEHQ
jgi:hypothetical protein